MALPLLILQNRKHEKMSKKKHVFLLETTITQKLGLNFHWKVVKSIKVDLNTEINFWIFFFWDLGALHKNLA